ncbi:hypothetical protein PMF13cell1_02889 [Blautia producta]|uniref:Response regulator n=1 Tax=Blautia producta TaxID=33035 RepID=A0A4P6M1K0_9FIRM|nr:hypothetical protein [Blautia producta]QBE97333.1 hypothetical protein PMF13cell1_02889 [Blautia producta]
MIAALYDENAGERRQLADYLKQCGREELRTVKVIPFESHVEFCKAVRDRVENFDLLVVAQDGTFSLEVMDMLRQYTTEMKIFWFSDLDFSVRSYSYGTLWFGKKPVDLQAMRKAFKRVIQCECLPKTGL